MAAVSWAREDWTRGEFTKAKASAMIDWLQTLPRVKHPASEAPEGMHVRRLQKAIDARR